MAAAAPTSAGATAVPTHKISNAANRVANDVTRATGCVRRTAGGAAPPPAPLGDQSNRGRNSTQATLKGRPGFERYAAARRGLDGQLGHINENLCSFGAQAQVALSTAMEQYQQILVRSLALMRASAVTDR